MNIFRKEGKIECDFDLDFLLDLDDLLSIDPIFSFINFLHLSLPSSKSEQMRSRASLEYPDIKLTIPSIDCFVHFFSSTETNVPFIQSLNFQKLLKQKKFREISSKLFGKLHSPTNERYFLIRVLSFGCLKVIDKQVHTLVFWLEVNVSTFGHFVERGFTLVVNAQGFVDLGHTS